MSSRTPILLGALLAVSGCRGEPTAPAGLEAGAPAEMAVTASPPDSVVLVVAGDMHANCVNPSNRATRTAAIVERYPDALVIVLGDNAGQSGTPVEYACYDKSWGKFKSRTYATIGNHELNLDPTAKAFYDYFNGVGVDSGRAGFRGRAYYSLAYGGWRILVANNHSKLEEQAAWMTRELATNSKRCTMAIWHRPYFTSNPRTAPLTKIGNWWKVLYAGRADVVLNGHDHQYERFNRMNPNRAVDTARGLREFVVGTGGTGLEDFPAVLLVGSQKRIKDWGVLKLTLWPARYKWEFVDVAGVVRDRGNDKCR